MRTPTPSLKRSCCLILAMFCTAASFARADEAPSTSQPQQAAQPAAPANTTYAAVAKQNGANKCLGRINQISNFLTRNNPNSGLVLLATGQNADQRILTSLMEIDGGGTTSFVSSSYAPGAGISDCSATYDAVTYWDANCTKVAENFKSFKPLRAMLKSIQILEGGQYAKVFLMPAGSGCISIKKEVLY